MSPRRLSFSPRRLSPRRRRLSAHSLLFSFARLARTNDDESLSSSSSSLLRRSSYVLARRRTDHSQARASRRALASRRHASAPSHCRRALCCSCCRASRARSTSYLSCRRADFDTTRSPFSGAMGTGSASRIVFSSTLTLDHAGAARVRFDAALHVRHVRRRGAAHKCRRSRVAARVASCCSVTCRRRVHARRQRARTLSLSYAPL